MEGARCSNPNHWIYNIFACHRFYAMPRFLASRVAPHCVSIGMKQPRIALWQGCSIYVSLSVAVLQLLTSPASYKIYAFQRGHLHLLSHLPVPLSPTLRWSSLVAVRPTWRGNLSLCPGCSGQLSRWQTQASGQALPPIDFPTTLPRGPGREIR